MVHSKQGDTVYIPCSNCGFCWILQKVACLSVFYSTNILILHALWLDRNGWSKDSGHVQLASWNKVLLPCVFSSSFALTCWSSSTLLSFCNLATFKLAFCCIQGSYTLFQKQISRTFPELRLIFEIGYERCMQQNANLNVARLQHESRVEELQQVNAKVLEKTQGK